MKAHRRSVAILSILLALISACSAAGGEGRRILPPEEPAAGGGSELSATIEPTATHQPGSVLATAAPTPTIASPTATEVVFEVGNEITIQHLRDLDIDGSEITFEQELEPTFYYQRHLVSYVSEGNKIYGLLTTPHGEPPEGGFKAIVFNHGYIPPAAYQTTEGYTAYVDSLARNGFVVFKIDYRGHGLSEGEPSGSYFSPGYTIDSIAALKSLQKLEGIDPQGIGMWGHSMAGNLVLRAMLIEPDIQAGVIWAGAVYSYADFAEYGINDNTYRPPEPQEGSTNPRRRSREIFDVYGRPDANVDYWTAVSLTENIQLLNRPLQLHHALNDPVVNIGYSENLAAVLLENGKEYEFYPYEGGGHNLVSPYFGQAMRRTVEFFQNNL